MPPPRRPDPIWPHDLPERIAALEAEVATLREQMARVLERLLLPEKPSEP